jgi:hypothetical protein
LENELAELYEFGLALQYPARIHLEDAAAVVDG